MQQSCADHSDAVCKFRDCPVGHVNFLINDPGAPLGCFELGSEDPCRHKPGMVAILDPFGFGECVCPNDGSYNTVERICELPLQSTHNL